MLFVLCTGAASGAVRLERTAAGEGCRIRADLPETGGRKVGTPQGVRWKRPPPGAQDRRDLPWGRMAEEVAALGAYQDHLPPWERALSFDQGGACAPPLPQPYPLLRPDRSLR